MKDQLILANSLLIFVFCILGNTILYTVIRMAVRNGTREANERLVESVREIERSLYELNKAANKKEST